MDEKVKKWLLWDCLSFIGYSNCSSSFPVPTFNLYFNLGEGLFI